VYGSGERGDDGPAMTIYASTAYLQTRGTARADDYTFLGAAPEHPWWREYRDTTAFDHPTLLVTAGAHPWRAYLSGIPSARTDAVGTVVRYTLVLHGGSDDSLTACGLAAVAAWLADIAAGSRTGRFHGALSSALDAHFPADEVDRLIAARPALLDRTPTREEEPDVGKVVGAGLERSTALADVESRIVAALRTLPVPPSAAEPDDRPDDWFGAVNDPAAREAFAARVSTLVRGRPGRALLLNLVGGADDAVALLEPGSPVALLVDGATPAGITPLQPVVEAKKASAPRPPARRAGVAVAGIAVVPLVTAFGVLAVTVLVLTLLVWLL
jgi:hypothetical protein